MRIRKFNETLDSKNDYILSVFANLQDRCDNFLSTGDEDLRYEVHEVGDNTEFYVYMHLPTPSSFGNTIDAYINYQKEVISIMEETKDCIAKVKIQYPDIKYIYTSGDTELDKINQDVNYSYMYWFGIIFQ